MSPLRVLLPALLAACRDEVKPSGDDTGSGVTVETGRYIDTAPDDTDTVDTGNPHTGDSAGDTGTVVDPSLVSLQPSPDGLIVNPGATWTLRVTATWDDGDKDEVEATWTSSDETIVAIEGDVATALLAGNVTLTASTGGLEAPLSVEVRDDNLLTVRVVDRATGLGVPEAKVMIDEGEQLAADEDGLLVTEVADGAAIVVDVYTRGYIPLTIWGTVHRELVVPIQLAEDDGTVEVSGSVDFSGVEDGAWDEVVVGLASPSLRPHPLLAKPDSLFAPDRDISVYGIDVALPANIYIEGSEEAYELPTAPGTVGVWTIAGPMPVTELTSGLDGTTDALVLLRSHAADMSWGHGSAGELAEGEAGTCDLAPSDPLTRTVDVDVGDLSLGFSGDEDALVLVGAEQGEEGLRVTGLGVGTGNVVVANASAVAPEWAVAVAQVDGLGSGGALCLSYGAVESGAATLAPLPQVADVNFTATDRSFLVNTDADTRTVHLVIWGGGDTVREIYLPGGVVEGVLTAPPYTFGYGRTTWELTALAATSGHFEDSVVAGLPDTTALAEGAVSASLLNQSF